MKTVTKNEKFHQMKRTCAFENFASKGDVSNIGGNDIILKQEKHKNKHLDEVY
jgi:hypothetical protein